MKALVILVRGLHLGYLGCYGNAWIDTPTLDRLAAEGVVFDQHYATCPDADGARRTWRAGHYDFGVSAADASSPPCSNDLIGLLRAGGGRTCLVVDDSRSTSTGFAADWDRVRIVSPTAAQATPLEPTLEAARGALDHVAGYDQWLLWVDLATPLPPWDVPDKHVDPYFQTAVEEVDDEGANEVEAASLEPLPNPTIGLLEPPEETTFLRLQRSYGAAVTYLDAGLGLFLDELGDAGLADEMLIIVTTDHGQALGEHGIFGPHRPWLHDELIHLPLLMRLPHGKEAGRRVAALTQPVDLFPTVLDAFGLQSPHSHDYSLLPLIDGSAEKVRAYACSSLRLGERIEWALRTPDWGFILPVAAPPDDPPRLPQLYVKPEDRWEVNNVLQHHLELAEHLERTLRSFALATRQPGPLRPPELGSPNSNPGEKSS
jgi:arylsulfatase A-like enzyme